MASHYLAYRLTDSPYDHCAAQFDQSTISAHPFQLHRQDNGAAGVMPHTLRHSYASVVGDLGYSEPTIAALLGHSAGSVTSRYAHHLDEVLVAAANRVAEEIFSMMTSPQPETTARKRNSSMLDSAEQVSA